MQALFGIIYSILFLSYVFTTFFVVYHIAHYSLDRRAAVLGILVFSSVAIVLLFTNAVLFFTLPFEEFLPNNTHTFG